MGIIMHAYVRRDGDVIEVRMIDEHGGAQTVLIPPGLANELGAAIGKIALDKGHASVRLSETRYEPEWQR